MRSGIYSSLAVGDSKFAVGSINTEAMLRQFKALHIRNNGSHSRLARYLKVTPMMVKLILDGKRGIGKKVARAMGYKAVVYYEPDSNTDGLDHVGDVDISA